LRVDLPFLHPNRSRTGKRKSMEWQMERTTFRMAVTAILALALVACGQQAKINPTAGGGGLTGSWTPETGGYSASFDNGAFSTTASDTGNLISQGSYVALSESEVQLNWKSNITGRDNTATCSRPSPDMLSCTDNEGRGFVLRRTAV
jgi:hypothetical protein